MVHAFVTGLVMPNASGCVVVAPSAPLADSMLAVPSARASVVPLFVRINNFNTRGMTSLDWRRHSELRLWGQRLIDFMFVSASPSPSFVQWCAFA
jgi:hypothetical protein